MSLGLGRVYIVALRTGCLGGFSCVSFMGYGMDGCVIGMFGEVIDFAGGG